MKTITNKNKNSKKEQRKKRSKTVKQLRIKKTVTNSKKCTTL